MQTSPDYGIRPSQLPAPDNDNGELAARLGGVISYRRTGRLLYRDNCVTLAPWLQINAPVTVSTTQSFNGSSCFVLLPDVSNECGIFKYFPAFTSLTMGLEFFFCLHGSTNTLFISLGVDAGPGPNNAQEARITIDRAAGTISHNGSTIASGLVFSSGFPEWDNIKIVCDFSSKTLIKVYFNEAIYYPNMALFLSGGVRRYSSIEIQTPPDATTGPTLIDDITVTINEALT